MSISHEYLRTAPFGLVELHLLHLVARSGSFTRAAEAACLTQSAVTRQVQGVERKLGLGLFERTTRNVRLTPAGRFLIDQTAHILGDVDAFLRQLREDYLEAPQQIRLGISRSIGLGYLPGFGLARARHDVNLAVQHDSSQSILAQLAADELDVGIFCPPERFPTHLAVTHRFRDAFTLITPRTAEFELRGTAGSAALKKELAGRSWLSVTRKSNTGLRLHQWAKRHGWHHGTPHEADSFDLIISLVALGLGCAFVPQRALPIYARRRNVQRHSISPRFSREIVVATRKARSRAPHIARFIENILF